MPVTILLVIFVFVLLIAALYYFIDREIYFYEGMRLGPRLQRWLYDRWARDYDKGKQASQQQDALMLAEPILEKLQNIPEPLILDLATGTGRLAVALVQDGRFRGKIIAMDISPEMLKIASKKLDSHLRQVDLLQYLTLPLPYPDNSFDAVCCLEALEVMPEMETPMSELQRVLRPGGLLVTSRGTEESGRKDKIKSRDDFQSFLEKFSFRSIEILPWWKYFDRVFAYKSGELLPAQEKNLQDVLLCRQCKQTNWEHSAEKIKCLHCGAQFLYTDAHILVFDSAQKS